MKKIINLSSDESSYPLPKGLKKALRNIKDNDLARYRKSPSLYERISKKHKIKNNQVMIRYGVIDLIISTLHPFLKKGDIVLTPKNGFHYYRTFFKKKKLKIINYSLKEEESSFKYDVKEIVNKVKSSKPKVVVIIDPHNPLGCSLSTEDIKIVLTSISRKTLVILDQTHEGFRQINERDITDLIHKNSNLLVFRSFSKTYGLAGIRLGYGLCGENVKEIVSYMDLYLGISAFNNALGNFALEHEKDFKKARFETVRVRDILVEELDKISGFKAYKTDTIFLLLESKPSNLNKLYKSLKKRGIIIKKFDRANDYYFLDKKDKERFVKVSVADKKTMSKIIKQIKKISEND